MYMTTVKTDSVSFKIYQHKKSAVTFEACIELILLFGHFSTLPDFPCREFSFRIQRELFIFNKKRDRSFFIADHLMRKANKLNKIKPRYNKREMKYI